MTKFDPLELARRTNRLHEARLVRSYQTRVKDAKLILVLSNYNIFTIGQLIAYTSYKRTYLVNALRRLHKQGILDRDLEIVKNKCVYTWWIK